MPLRRPASCVRRWSLLLAGLAAPALLAVPTAGRQPDATAPAAPAASTLVVPPVPAGTPEEVVAFVESLLPPKTEPASQEAMFHYLRDVSRVSVEAMDTVLPRLKAGDPLQDKAVMIKLQNMLRLWQLGDQKAGAAMAAFAATIADGTSEAAAEARRMALAYEVQQMFSAGTFDAAPAIVKKAADLLARNPDDEKTAGLVMQLCRKLEHVPNGGAIAAAAFAECGAVLARSGNPRIKQLADIFAAKQRLLSLVGAPMEVSGKLIDGTPFDLKSLAGKVVLIDFWATWCGPCIAEIPHVIEQYEKYHDKGFEVIGISLDRDRGEKTAQDQVTEAVTQHKIPWPIMTEGARLAQFYGITGIPHMILIGRDGNVIATSIRGAQLDEQLAALFKDAG